MSRPEVNRSGEMEIFVRAVELGSSVAEASSPQISQDPASMCVASSVWRFSRR